jgi:type III secretory pathway component EscT
MIMTKLMGVFFLSLGLVFATNFAYAQSSGTLTGTVTDAAGAIIPNATVTARNSETGVNVVRTSNEAL